MTLPRKRVRPDGADGGRFRNSSAHLTVNARRYAATSGGAPTHGSSQRLYKH
jgi:hypothetical protein